MAYDSCMQYTLRGIPEAVDKAIRQRARTKGTSLNEAAVETLAEGLGLGKGKLPVRDLDDVVGTWVEDEAAEAAFKAQDEVDRALWK